MQVYNGEDTIPRVLPCGHSTCEVCLRRLPQRFATTVRCPACNQIVKYPQPQGPSALPKNIDLLRLVLEQNPNPTHKPNSSQSLMHAQKNKINQSAAQEGEFLPRLWSEELYSTWKDWIVPKDAVSVEERGEDSCSVFRGRISSSCSTMSSFFNFFVKENRNVSLVRVAASSLSDSKVKFSYTARLMDALNRLEERERDGLGLILGVSWREFPVCKAYGLWMDSENGIVFLVCERLNGDSLGELRNGVVGEDWDILTDAKNQRIYRFAMVGLELCEIVMSLNSSGLVSGYLALSLFYFYDFGHVFVDLNEMLVMGRRVQKSIAEVASARRSDCSETEAAFAKLIKTQAFVSPELLLKLLYNEGITLDCGSDVWPLACVLISLLKRDSGEELLSILYHLFLTRSEENCDNHLGFGVGWMENVASVMDTLSAKEFLPLRRILCSCLNLDRTSHLPVLDIWRCIRGFIIKPHLDILPREVNRVAKANTVYCLILGNLCNQLTETDKGFHGQRKHASQRSKNSSEAGAEHVGAIQVDRDLVKGLSMGNMKSINLQGHIDCVTGLAVGGGFLFSSSFDKTVNVWSLQDFTCIRSLRGHEHRVMAVVFVDEEQPLCISGDSGGGIFIWSIGTSVGDEPLKSWYEHKDWRYSGIHALAVSGNEYLYTGSGDKSIKAWSLQDYSISCTMNGHRSVVSALAVCDGVLYSGSWDGTIRLWCLNDHSPLTVLGGDTPGIVTSVCSLAVDCHMLIAAYDNGCIKIWRDDVFVRSTQTDNGAILALAMKGKWLFMGGWNKTIYIQELSGDDFQVDTRPVGSIPSDSAITALSYWEGKLLVGFADKVIKAYYCSP